MVRAEAQWKKGGAEALCLRRSRAQHRRFDLRKEAWLNEPTAHCQLLCASLLPLRLCVNPLPSFPTPPNPAMLRHQVEERADFVFMNPVSFGRCHG